MRINLTDNSIARSEAATFHRRDVAALFPIADKKIAQLCRENENLLIFPYSVETSRDRIGEESVMSIQNTEDPEKVWIRTGNVMGFIGVGNLQVKIKSRFDEGRDDFMLHYMLQKVLSFNLFDLSHNNEQEDVFDLIIFMFPYFLKKALRQGVYREYQRFKYNDANVKGTIDLGRHITRNIPFMGRIAYTTREYSHDNSMMELVRHTIEFMKTKRYGSAVLNIDRETRENVKVIIENTPSYDRNERSSIVGKNLRCKNHPYYTEYMPLRSLCLQILRMEEVKYGESEDEICGILFDGAWLWEEYLSTILEPMGFQHPHNKQGKGGFFIYEDNTGYRMPDFYRKDFVLDAKYKRLEEKDRISELEVSDQNQMIVYLKHLKVQEGGFVCPLNKREQLALPQARLKSGHEHIAIYGIQIPDTADDFVSFSEMMRVQEESLKDRIEKSID